MIKVALTYTNAVVPKLTHSTDAGYDFSCVYPFEIPPKEFLNIDLGLSFEFPTDVVLLIQGRSGLAKHKGVFTIGNVIDSGYRGTIGCTLVNMGEEKVSFFPGDRICQGLFLNLYRGEIEQVSISQLTKSDRGTKGFGSSGL